MDIRKTTTHDSGDNRSPTLDKIKQRKEERQRTSSSSSTGSQTQDQSRLAVPDPSVIPIDISGNLHKQGRLLKKWKPRFFQVQGNHLYYFKNFEKKECSGLIDLQKCYYVGKSDAASFGSTFELQTWGRTHLLAARDERDAEKWINVIKRKMVPEARNRDKKGSKGEVDAIIPNEMRTRRATIKMNRSGKKETVKPSASAHEMSFSGLKSLSEDAEDELEVDIEQKPTSVSTSQSNPEFQVNTTNSPSIDTHATATDYNVKESNLQDDTSIVTTQNSALLQNPSAMSFVPPPPLEGSDFVELPPSPPSTLVPLKKKDETIDHHRTKKSLPRPMSVADIVLPPPPSLVPLKQSNTLSDTGLPPSLNFKIPSQEEKVDLPVSSTNERRGNTQMPLHQHDLGNIACTDLPPPIEIASQQFNIAGIELPSPINDPVATDVELSTSKSDVNSPPPLSTTESSLPLPPSLELPPQLLQTSITPETQHSIVDIQLLKRNIPPLTSIDHIPSAIDQLRFLLGNDVQLPPSRMTSTALPEMDMTWLSKRTGIEQLRHFLAIECTS